MVDTHLAVIARPRPGDPVNTDRGVLDGPVKPGNDRNKVKGILVMNITPAGATPSRRMSPDYFTGTVWQDPIVEAPAPARIRAALVTFEPGARTAWHTHPLGQTLHVTRGNGRVQSWGGPIREVRAGDTVWFPPGEKHWHGASPTSAMAHIAMQEALDGVVVEWLEHVTDEQYGGKGG